MTNPTPKQFREIEKALKSGELTDAALDYLIEWMPTNVPIPVIGLHGLLNKGLRELRKFRQDKDD